MPQEETPARMSICDLQSGTQIEVMFNPTDLKRRITVNYAKRAVLGASSEPLEYLQTANQELDFDLFYVVENANKAREHSLDQSDEAMRFLESLCYSPQSPESITRNAPPRVLLVWPNTMSITCRLTEVEFTMQRWNKFGFPTQWTASTRWEEARINRLTKQDVITFGAIRPPQGVVEDIEPELGGGPLGRLASIGIDITDQAAVDLALSQGL